MCIWTLSEEHDKLNPADEGSIPEWLRFQWQKSIIRQSEISFYGVIFRGKVTLPSSFINYVSTIVFSLRVF